MPEEDTGRAATAPHRDAPSGVAALLIVDMVNCFDFSGGDRLKAKAAAAADAIVALRGEADARDVPVIYVTTISASGIRKSRGWWSARWKRPMT